MNTLAFKHVPAVPFMSLALLGRRGIEGRSGTPGQQGEQGDPGVPGERGAKGEQGDPGNKGERGPKGSRGDPGNNGKQGPQGIPGVDGKPGKKGKDGIGVKGEQGIPGPKGETGPQGETGPPPEHRWIGTALQFRNPDGSWGKQVNLKGDRGVRGDGTTIGWNTYEIINGGGGGDDVQYDTNINVVSDTLMYKGEADPGTATSAAAWRVAQFITNAEGDMIKTWVGGSAEFNKVWDDYKDL